MAESIAEMFFLVAVDDIGGRPRARTDLLHSGVAGGVFADLALRRFIRVNDTGLVRPTSATGCDAAGSAAAHVVEAVAQQGRTCSVRHWIEEIGPAVFELVSQQLADAGVIRREQAGGLRRHEIYPPADLIAAATPRLELARMLRDPRQFTLVFVSPPSWSTSPASPARSPPTGAGRPSGRSWGSSPTTCRATCGGSPPVSVPRHPAAPSCRNDGTAVSKCPAPATVRDGGRHRFHEQ